MKKGPDEAKAKAEWRTVTSYVLMDTPYELVPDKGTRRWYVVHGRDRLVALSDALPLKAAKREAERLQSLPGRACVVVSGV